MVVRGDLSATTLTCVACGVACRYGGASVQVQKSALSNGTDVVVGTPGRVIDLMMQGSLKLQEVKLLVLDEADEMLDMGFGDQLEEILASIPPKTERQTMLWSATVPAWVHKVAQKYLHDAQTIDLVGTCR